MTRVIYSRLTTFVIELGFDQTISGRKHEDRAALLGPWAWTRQRQDEDEPAS